LTEFFNFFFIRLSFVDFWGRRELRRWRIETEKEMNGFQQFKSVSLFYSKTKTQVNNVTEKKTAQKAGF